MSNTPFPIETKKYPTMGKNPKFFKVAGKIVFSLSLAISCLSVVGNHFGTGIKNERVKNSRPLVSFIDDDGSNNVLLQLKPLFIARNVPVGLAIVGDAEIVTDETKRQEVLSLQDDYGWEILSHSMSHKNYRMLSGEETVNDFTEYLETFSNYGFDVKELVYPYGFSSRNTRRIASEYFYDAFNNFAGGSDIRKNRFSINRLPLGTYMGIGRLTISDFKSIIDSAKAQNNWVVFMTHFGEKDNDIGIIEEVLDYVIDSGIAIVTPYEAAVETNET